MLAAGFDAGVRYDERLERDMIAVPIGPRQQRYRRWPPRPPYFAAHGRPKHPREAARPRRDPPPLRQRGLASARIREGRRGHPSRARRGRWSATPSSLEIAAAIGGLGLICDLRRTSSPPYLGERRARTRARRLAAALLGAFPLLSQPPPHAGAAARLRRFPQAPAEIMIGNPNTSARPSFC